MEQVRIAAPCKADWEQMIGSERVRFCGQCNLNVFNLSGMSRLEAESLIARTEGRLCVRFYRRFDGSIVTQDCPVGLRAIQRRVSYLAKAIVATAFTFLATIGFQTQVSSLPMFREQHFTGLMMAPNSLGRARSPSPERLVVGELPAPQERQSKKRTVK